MEKQQKKQLKQPASKLFHNVDNIQKDPYKTTPKKPAEKKAINKKTAPNKI